MVKKNGRQAAALGKALGWVPGVSKGGWGPLVDKGWEEGLSPWTSAQTKLQYPDAGRMEEGPWVLNPIVQTCR